MIDRYELERRVEQWVARRKRQPFGIDRRNLLLGGAAAVLSMAPAMRARAQAPGMPELKSVSPKLKGTGQVRICNPGGAIGDAERIAMYEPFEKLTGIKVIEQSGSTITKIKAQVDSKNIEWDVATTGRSNAMALLAQGDYAEPIDYSVIDAPGLAERYRQKYTVTYFLLATVMSYRADAFRTTPVGWKDFWDTKNFKGPRNYMAGNAGLGVQLFPALIADGAPMDKLYPFDIPRAFASLDKIKDDIVTYWTTGAQSAQLMADNETVMGIAWNGRIGPLVKQGLPVGMSWDGAQFLNDDYIIPKGTPNYANAMKYIAFALLPESQARFSMLIDYGYTNSDADALVPAERKKILPSAYLDKGFFQDDVWEMKHFNEMTEAWAKWVLK
ncbi:ABC transporter substrate-binding protein [Terrarubrum flagellatum]|uniref:ABC transporter substrate-binding protein n=1 Tax=Terrirubrum flagellatum TaxID=2895980 RepID=UPI0031456384